MPETKNAPATVVPSQKSHQEKSPQHQKQPLPILRVFSKNGVHPLDEITWVKRDAVVGSGDKKVFEQRGVEFPDFWSQNAVDITSSKYFRGKLGTPARETSAKQMISRVVRTIRGWGERFGYFASPEQAHVFEDELSHILVHQKGSFNSPVWFNVGTKEAPQCSACFILEAQDNMPAILDWIKTEGMIFKGGSGSGINLSTLRSRDESLSQGGRASGPVSFMRGADAVAGMIKSGGTTRRAAKMVILNVDHPDILEFVNCKVNEEKKIRALMGAGYNMTDLNDEAWNSIQFQNANNSVRIPDEFMKAYEQDGSWETKYVTTGQTAHRYKARELMEAIAQATWECGDPGVQFDTTIQRWHTCPETGPITASNPCSEYLHIDNSACNLASINLMKFVREDGTFMVREFRQAVDVFILAQDIIVEGSSYPTEKIDRNARDYRQLGLGFANLGTLLMTRGIPYDSDKGRAIAGAISSLLGGEAYRYSTEVAKLKGAFAGFAKNREAMLRVLDQHRGESYKVDAELVGDAELIKASRAVWEEALAGAGAHGVRNSQATVIAPTGTTSFMMDCDTTGCEPEFSLVKMKQLAGGGWMKIVNASTQRALEHLGYSNMEVDAIIAWISEHGTIEGAPYITSEHLAIFDCAVKPAAGVRSISWKGHVKMVAAIQPFISGAISKTFNMPEETTREEIMDAYVMSWKLGVKAFAIYRDNSKATQALYTSKKKPETAAAAEAPKEGAGGKQSVKHPTPSRRKLPATRTSQTHKFVVAGHSGFLIYSAFEDGNIGEIFLRVSKQGSTLAGLLDAFAISVSIALQYGVPFKALAHRFIYTRFEPAGFTENPDVRIATSIIDYIFRYLSLQFLTAEELTELGITSSHIVEEEMVSHQAAPETDRTASSPATSAGQQKSGGSSGSEGSVLSGKLMGNGFVVGESVCRLCGGMMVRSGTCQTCLQCGSSSGGCS